MAPPHPTAPLSGFPLLTSCEFSPCPGIPVSISPGRISQDRRTNCPNTAVALLPKLPGQPLEQCVNISSEQPSPVTAHPPPAATHSDLDLLSASCSISLSPHTVLPPLSWATTPLSVRVATRPSGLTQYTVKEKPAQKVVPVPLPPASHLAARHHPPLVRYLLDRTAPPPSSVRLPPSITSAVFASEGSITPVAARRRLSAPAADRYPRTSVCHLGEASANSSTGVQNLHKRFSPGAADTAAAVSFVGPCIIPDSPCTVSDFARSFQRVDPQKSGKSKITPLPALLANIRNARVSHLQTEIGVSSQKERMPIGPLLQQLLTPQAGTHYPGQQGLESWQSGQHWQHPKVLIPPFFSSPAALQRSESTLQSELASSILRCRAAELKQQRLLQIAAAVVHQAVRVHASRIADIIEIRGAAAAEAAEAVPLLEVSGTRVKPGRTLGLQERTKFDVYDASPKESDGSERFINGYYDWLCGPADLSSRSTEGESLQCLPVIVAPAGTDGADHRLAVHSFLRECMRRCQCSSIRVNSAEGVDSVSQKGNLFLRFAVVRPTDCSSVGSAMHAIYEQVTRVPSLSSFPSSFTERSRVARKGGSGTLQQNAFKRKTNGRNSVRGLVSSVSNGALDCEDSSATCNFINVFSASNHVYTGEVESPTCCDGGAAAAWGENTWLRRGGAFLPFAAADDACTFLSACIESRQDDETAATAELQQLIRRDLWGAGAGTGDVRFLHLQEEFWEIEKKAAAASALIGHSKSRHTCGAANRSFSCHASYRGPDGRNLQEDAGVHQWRSVQQQQRESQNHQSIGCSLSYLARGSYSKSSRSSRSHVRKIGRSDNVCEKLGIWWAAQQQQLLQQNSGMYSGDATIAGGFVTFSSRRIRCKRGVGENCAAWSVHVPAGTTHLRDSAAVSGSSPMVFFEERKEEEQRQSTEKNSEEGEEAEKKQKDSAVESSTTDRESTDEDDPHSRAQALSGTERELLTTAAGRATTSRLRRDGSSTNSMQPAAVVIVLEEAEAFPGGLLVKLLQLLALLRRQLSIPFIVVATASTSVTVLQELCDIPLSSSCSLTIEPATLLQPARVQQQLLQLVLCCPAALPFALPLAAAERLLQSVEETSPSVLQLLRRLQLLLRVFYQNHPLAFLCRGLDGVSALLLLEDDECVLKSTEQMSQQQRRRTSSSSSTTAHAGAAVTSGMTTKGEGALSGLMEVEDATAEQEKTCEERRRCSITNRKQQLLQKCPVNGNMRFGEPVSECVPGQAIVAAAALRDVKYSARQLHALRVVKQLRRRVELLAFSSLTEDHVNLLRQLLRHTNEVYIHLAAAQHEGLLFFDTCCWQQVQLQRQHQRRALLAATAAASYGAALAGSSSLLPPLQRDAAASTLALRCRPEEDDEVQNQQPSNLKEATGGGSPLLGGSGKVTCSSAENHIRQRKYPGCRRLAGCVARRSTVALLQRWWGVRGLLLLQKVEEEEKQRQQQQQQEHKHLLTSGTAAGGFSEKRATTGGQDRQSTLTSLKLKLLCKEVLPAASVELLQRRVGCCMAYRLLFVLQQQLQRCRRLASGAEADMGTTAGAGDHGGGLAEDNVKSPADKTSQQNEENAAAEEEDLLLRIAAQEETHTNCRQTIEMLDLLVGAHEESSCLLRKCKPHARVQEMAKACFAVEQDVRRVVTSLFHQFAVAAPARLCAAAAAIHCQEVLVDPRALVLPLKLFRAQVKRETRLLRLLAAAEEAQQKRQEHQLHSGNNLAGGGVAHATAVGKTCELPQQQLPFSLEVPAHSIEVVRALDALDVLIRDLSKAANLATAAAPDACVGVAAAGGVDTAGTSSSRIAANTQQDEKEAAHNDINSSRRKLMGTRVTAKQHTLARCSSDGATLHTGSATAQKKRRHTHPDVDTLRVLLSLKRRFLRWVEEALLLLLLPLPGWHPLGGELAVWGGSLGFEIAVAVHSPPGGAIAAGCSSLSHPSAAGVTAQKRRTAGTPSGRLAAAADLVCTSFEAAPQTETLQHAVMGSTAFLQRFNVPVDEEDEDEEKQACLFQAQQQQRQHQSLQCPLQPTQEATAKMRPGLGRRAEEGTVGESYTRNARGHEEEIMLEDVAILLRLVGGAGRRINMWDLFCAFCRDLLRDCFEKKKVEIRKRLQTKCLRGKVEEHGRNRPGNNSSGCSPRADSNSSSPPPRSTKSSRTQSSQRRKRGYVHMSESAVEEEVLRLMEAESYCPHVEPFAVCDISKDNVTEPLYPSGSHHVVQNLTAECRQQQKAASSCTIHTNISHANCSSRISHTPVGTPHARVSRMSGASASPTFGASPVAVASLAREQLRDAADPSMPSSVTDERAPWTLLQQLQLRFAVAVETLDHQLGVIRLPSAASSAAAVERVMLAEDGVENAAVNRDFIVVPPRAEQVNDADNNTAPRGKTEETEKDDEEMSDDDEERMHEVDSSAADGRGDRIQNKEKQKTIEACEAGERQLQDEYTEQLDRLYSRAKQNTRICRGGLAACGQEKSAVSHGEGNEEDADEKELHLDLGGGRLMQEIRNMRKLLQNVFARRTHFVSVYAELAPESDRDKVQSQKHDVDRSTCEEAESPSLCAKTSSRQRKSHRRSKKKIVL